MVIFILFYISIVSLTIASRCPELRKPHATDCSLFYKCIDLPNNEFVWIPAKCNDGLVFEPNLKICVLSNNPKICQKNINVLNKIPSFDDNDFNVNLDSSIIFNNENNSYSAETSINDYDTSVTPQTTENIICQLITNYKVDIPSKNVNEGQAYLSLLNTLVTKILIRDSDLKSQFPEIKQNVTKLSSADQKQDLQDTQSEFNQDYDDDSLKKVISIVDNLGNRQYISVSKFNELKDKLKLESLDILDCTENVRLPNETDCRKYYTCSYGTNPVVRTYICPKYTAFNRISRQCDTRSHSMCEKKIFNLSSRNSNANLDWSLQNLCKTTGKVADVQSKKHFYLCYMDNLTSEIKSVRFECPKYLIFCQEKSLCTIEQLCYK